MRKTNLICICLLGMLLTACSSIGSRDGRDGANSDIIASVDNTMLTREVLQRDMPVGLDQTDSVTFARMYIDNWILKQLKISRAELVLSSSADIERLVEDYRQSLIMRRLDQYYVDNTIDPEVTQQQISAYYRSNAASFKLDHNKVRGVVVKIPRNFRNTSTLTTALKHVNSNGIAEVEALAEKHSLLLHDMTTNWVSFSDFLSNLPTERSRSYDNLLTRSDVQHMSADDAQFYFIITDVARKGSTSPMECVESDIRRRLYAERRAEIVDNYEQDLLREAMEMGRISVTDTTLMYAISHSPEHTNVDNTEDDIIIDEIILEEDIAVEQPQKEDKTVTDSADSTALK